MTSKDTSAVRNNPNLVSPKLLAPAGISESSQLLNVVTTAANAAAMMKATASSTRLPCITKSLKPFVLTPWACRARGTPIM
jgi:hypothetical protein